MKRVWRPKRDLGHVAIDDIALNPLTARVTSDPTVRLKIIRRYG
jgi:hypothetical protein